MLDKIPVKMCFMWETIALRLLHVLLIKLMLPSISPCSGLVCPGLSWPGQKANNNVVNSFFAHFFPLGHILRAFELLEHFFVVVLVANFVLSTNAIKGKWQQAEQRTGLAKYALILR